MKLYEVLGLRSTSTAIGMLEFLVLIVPVLTIYLPNVGVSSFFIILCLGVSYARRTEWHLEHDLKRAFWMLFAWGVLFTLVSENPSRSVKGAYDMLRAAIFFPIGLIVANHLRNANKAALFSVLAVATIMSNFFYPRGGYSAQFFFGYHDNPNNVAVSLFFAMMLALLVYQWRGLSERYFKAILIVVGLGVAAGLMLFVMTNSRQAWLALFVSTMGYTWLNSNRPAKQKILVSVLGSGMLLLLLVAFNNKGISLSRREEIWGGLFNLTTSNHPWFGYGLNVVKDVLKQHDIITQTAHNLFLEVYVSSGIVGIVWFVFFLVLLWMAYSRFKYKKNTIFFVGVCGFAGYFIMAMFDLKLSSYRFFGTYAFFLGLIYSQRILDSEISEQAYDAKY